MFKAESREQVLAKELEAMGIALREAIQRAERAEAREMAWHDALDWYLEKAEALARYGAQDPPNTNGMMAVVTELSLDGGKRARRVIAPRMKAKEPNETPLPPPA